MQSDEIKKKQPYNKDYLSRLFRFEEEVQSSKENQKLKELSTTKVTLQEMFNLVQRDP